MEARRAGIDGGAGMVESVGTGKVGTGTGGTERTGATKVKVVIFGVEGGLYVYMG